MRFVLLAALVSSPAMSQESHDCVIEPFLVLQVGSAVEGVVESINMTRGAAVKRGDVLAQLESTVELKTLELAEAQARSTLIIDLALGNLDLMKKEYERARELADRNVGTLSDLDVAEANYKQAELEVLQARETMELQQYDLARTKASLERRTITSPIDGILLRRLIGPGEYVYSQAQIAQIAAIDPLYVDVFLPSDLYDTVAVGQSATVRPAPPIEGAYEATVTAIDKVFDAASDTFGVRLEMPNLDYALPAGVDCSITFPSD